RTVKRSRSGTGSTVLAMRWRSFERGTRKSERGTDAPLPFRAPRSALRGGAVVRVPHRGHKRRREGGPALASPRGGANAVLHAGRHSGHGADEATARDALERTLKWLERCARRHGELSDGPTVQQTLWPILQGGAHSQLRIEGLRRILDQAEWTGLAVGGLSVGEPKAVMYETLERLEPRLPPAVPRYLMGVGFPEDLVAAVAR